MKKDIKIIYSQKKFDSYLKENYIKIEEISIENIKLLYKIFSNEFKEGNLSLDEWSSMSEKLWWLMVSNKFESKDQNLFNILHLTGELNYYIRQKSNLSIFSNFINEIYKYLDI